LATSTRQRLNADVAARGPKGIILDRQEGFTFQGPQTHNDVH